ncbi:glutathione S-transferase 1-like [Brevipalpus obovatus]|uniref:glutathione S-transferase 1-like n=1 Tax=Brevipalpus obovatus TaxID=246614 RepID=UPI003D9DF28A
MDLYFMAESPPCRAVLMVAEYLGLRLNLISVDLTNNEQFSPQFSKINPFHCVPTLVDDGFVIWESRAIMTYLVEKFYKDHYLYPVNLRERPLIDQFLYFDGTQLYKAQTDYLAPYLSGREPRLEDELKFRQKLVLLNQYLDGREYLATGHITLADLSILASLSFAEACRFDFRPYPCLVKWMERLKVQIPGYNRLNSEPMKRFSAYMQEKIEEVKQGKNESESLGRVNFSSVWRKLVSGDSMQNSQ